MALPSTFGADHLHADSHDGEGDDEEQAPLLASQPAEHASPGRPEVAGLLDRDAGTAEAAHAAHAGRRGLRRGVVAVVVGSAQGRLGAGGGAHVGAPALVCEATISA